MSKEYTNEYTGFNDWKVLFHFEHLKKIVAGNFPPPVAVDTDPSNACNQNCIYCNAKAYRKSPNYSRMPKGHLLKLADFYAKWGVQSTCIAGGGESLLNGETKEFMNALCENNIEIGVITNGVLLDQECAVNLTQYARYCGISCDGATRKTYKIMRGCDDLEKVIKNVSILNKIRITSGSKLDTNLKCLIHPYNYF